MAEPVRVRCVWPDRWLEARLELAADATVEEAKRRAIAAMRKTDFVDADRFYVEFRERRVFDESVTLRELGASDGAVLSIRAHDLHHPPLFEG
jgi:hypothetical protein